MMLRRSLNLGLSPITTVRPSCFIMVKSSNAFDMCSVPSSDKLISSWFLSDTDELSLVISKLRWSSFPQGLTRTQGPLCEKSRSKPRSLVIRVHRI